jgi:Coenzyme PQQ synthesis protein D (PqqD)
MITLATRIAVPEQVMYRDLGGEAVILELESGQYYGLDEIGSTMWRRLQEHADVAGALGALRAEYDVAEDELERDLLEFVGRLAEFKLVELRDA